MTNRITQKIADDIRRENRGCVLVAMDMLGGTRTYTPEQLAIEIEQETEMGRSVTDTLVRYTIERKLGRR